MDQNLIGSITWLMLGKHILKVHLHRLLEVFLRSVREMSWRIIISKRRDREIISRKVSNNSSKQPVSQHTSTVTSTWTSPPSTTMAHHWQVHMGSLVRMVKAGPTMGKVYPTHLQILTVSNKSRRSLRNHTPKDPPKLLRESHPQDQSEILLTTRYPVSQNQKIKVQRDVRPSSLSLILTHISLRLTLPKTDSTRERVMKMRHMIPSQVISQLNWKTRRMNLRERERSHRMRRKMQSQVMITWMKDSWTRQMKSRSQIKAGMILL